MSGVAPSSYFRMVGSRMLRNLICICGHPDHFHAERGACRFKRSNCKCATLKGIFAAEIPHQFLQFHRVEPSGHALTQGVLASMALGRDLRFPRDFHRGVLKCSWCKRFTLDLEPRLALKGSHALAGSIKDARSTRLYCEECLVLENLGFSGQVAFVLKQLIDA